MILRASDQQIVKKLGGYRGFVEKLVRDRWRAPVNWTISGVLPAEIIRSSWVVRCPFCAGAQVIDFGEAFFCVDCCMQANGFKAMGVLFPEDVDAIEAVLLKRPDPNTRNWCARESLEDLKRENIAHGIEV